MRLVTRAGYFLLCVAVIVAPSGGYISDSTTSMAIWGIAMGLFLSELAG